MVNGKGILREMAVGNNKPTCHEAKSIFKALRFSGTTAQKSITSCIFWGCITILHSQGAAFDCRRSPLKVHTLLIDYAAATETGPFSERVYEIMDRTVTGF